MSVARSSYRDFLIKGLIAFVIIVGGVVTGMFIAGKTGLAGQESDHGASSIPPPATLREGELFPDISVLSKSGETMRLLDLVEGSASQSTIVVFLSSGCIPCKDYVADLSASIPLKNAKQRVILLSPSVKSFEAGDRLDIFEIAPSTIDDLLITAFPTTCEVASDGTIRKVWVFYNPNNMPEFM